MLSCVDVRMSMSIVHGHSCRVFPSCRMELMLSTGLHLEALSVIHVDSSDEETEEDCIMEVEGVSSGSFLSLETTWRRASI